MQLKWRKERRAFFLTQRRNDIFSKPVFNGKASLKRLFFFIGIFQFSGLLFAQSFESLKVESYTLENGLKVCLNPDKNATKVFGGVMIKSGSIHEPPEATGLSHYLEHMLFKGTKSIGSRDYEKEEPHYERIIDFYDQLEGKSAREKANILRQINEESKIASRYTVPNEFSTISKGIGCTGLSAFAGYDVTFYHSYFPSENIGPWLELNCERFIDPIFRTFQSEMEVVYEEKNRWDDDYENDLYEATQELLYQDQVYGLWPTIGKTEHLKSPSLSKTIEFFNSQYVPENMALVLSGNFDIEIAKELIQLHFSKLKGPKFSQKSFPEIEPLKEIRTKEIKVTPFPVGAVLFPIPKKNAKNREVVDLISYLLANENGTGLLDKLIASGEFQMIETEIDDHLLAASFGIYFVPKRGNSLDQGKELIIKQIQSLSIDPISDQTLSAAKKNIVIDFYRSLENLENRGLSILEADIMEVSWSDYLSYPKRIKRTSKEDIFQASKKHFANNYGFLKSEKGSPRKDKIKPPEFQPILSDQSTLTPWANDFLKRSGSENFEIQFIDFNSVDTFQLGKNTGIIVSNSTNDLFSLEVRVQAGYLSNSKLSDAFGVLNFSGTTSRSNSQIKSDLESIACKYEIEVNSQEVIISLEGLESQFENGLDILLDILYNSKINHASIDQFANSQRILRTQEIEQPFNIGFALIRYAVFGSKTRFLSRTPSDEIQKTDPLTLKKELSKILEASTLHFNYFGSRTKDTLIQLLASRFGEGSLLISDPKEVDLKIQPVESTEILLIHDKKARQSQVYFYIEGDKYNNKDYGLVEAFNSYYGESLTGVIFKEIREYRSLAYSIFGRYITPTGSQNKGYLITGFGSQSEKTMEAIEVMMDLQKEFKRSETQIESLRSMKIHELNASSPERRDLGSRIYELKKQGYEKDPNIGALETYRNLEFSQMAEFYNSQFKEKPFVITIYGNKADLDLGRLNQIGKVRELQIEDIIIR